MKHKIAAFLMLPFILLGPGLSASFASEPAAGVILMVSGQVFVLEKGAAVPAESGMPVGEGATLSSKGGTAAVLLKSGKMEHLKPGEQLILSEKGISADASGLAGRLMATLQETTQAGKGPTIKGMVRGGTELSAVYPFNSAVLAADLRFVWEPVDGLTDVAVTIKTRKPRFRMVLPAEPDTERVALPKDKSLSQDMTYYWSVSGKTMAGGTEYASNLLWFSILGKEHMENLKKDLAAVDAIAGMDDNTRYILRANVFVGYKLYHKAIETLKTCAQNGSEQTDIRPMVKGIYLKMKNLQAAAQI